MKAAPDASIKPHIFGKNAAKGVTFHDNFELEWLILNKEYHYRNLNGFPLNPLNMNLTIMQSKNGQEIPYTHGNYLAQ
jgi:hypothetical protein